MIALRNALLPLVLMAACLAPRLALAQDASDDRVSIMRFIPDAEKAAIRACRSTYDVTAAKEQADRAVSVDTTSYSLGGGEVDWPAGCYYFAGTLSQKHTVIERGVSSGMPSGGSSVWKFPPSTAGIIIDGAATSFCKRAPKSTSGVGTELIGITLIGGGGPPDATSHGVWMCFTVELVDVSVEHFAGDGVHVDPNGVGNANMFRIYNGFIGFDGRYGIYQHGGDSNAGLVVGTSMTDLGGGCDMDLSFLGNTHTGEICQSAGLGLTHATYDGAAYQCLSVKCSEVVPGKDTAVWYPVKPDPHYKPYIQGRAYLIAGDYVATDPNARALFLGVYSEEGDPLSDVRPPSMVQGGLQGSGFTVFSVPITVQSGLGSYVSSPTGFGSTERTISGKLGVESVIGGAGQNGDVVRSISRAVSNDNWRLRWSGPDLREDWDNLDAGTVMLQTGPKTTQTFARGAPQPEQIALPKGVFLAGGAFADLRYVGEAAAMPVAGTFAKGDRVFNNAPRVLGAQGSQYTVTGWLRLTTGDKHVLGVDWVEMRSPTGS